MVSARKWWPLIIVGGGPAAALQIKRLRYSGTPTSDILVVAERWGAPGMEFLGPSRLQSYIWELDLDETLPVITSPGSLQPTGDEYHRYAQDVLRRSGVARCQGRVIDLERTGNHFVVTVRTSADVRKYETPYVVLATGTRPKRPPAAWQSVGAQTYEDVYRDINAGATEKYRNRIAYVVGSGNSALQTAAILASAAAQTSVLACRYLGMYPSETSDRFAWRAASQLTWELVVKCGRGIMECNGSSTCVRFLVYDSMNIAGDDLSVSFRFDSNLHQMGRHSTPDVHSHIPARRHADGWTEERPLHQCALVWATGSEPVYPDGALIDYLAKDENGYIRGGPQGETEIPGLFAIGSCAGRRAVNEMIPAGSAFELVTRRGA